MEKIYLNIAGFTILCDVVDVEYKYHSKKFIDMVLADYSRFILEKPKKPDYTLKIFFSGNLLLDIRAGNGNFENYYIRSFHVNENKRIISTHNPLGSFDFEFLINRMIYKYLLPHSKGFNIHGSSVGHKNNAFIFEGKSGAGKSTTAQLLKGLCDILSDDSVIIKKVNGKFYYYQTVLHEKNYNFEKSSNAYLIDKVFFIRKAEKCSIKEIKNKDLVLRKILRQVFMYSDKVNIQFPTITEFVNKTDFYYLYVKKDEKIFKDFFRKEVLAL